MSLIVGKNDIATTHPNLAKEAEGWDPTTVSAGSDKKREWKCQKNHIWKAVIKSRTRGSDCPYCSNTKILIGFNDLVTDPLPGVPCYLLGTAPPAAGAWPFVTGTATTTDGFLANSTSAYNPYQASQLVISHGQQGWYFVNVYNLDDPLDTTEALQYWNEWQITTDTANTWIQFCPFVKFTTSPAGKVQLPTQLVFDSLLYETYPWTYDISNNNLITGDATITYAGFAIRNNTPGATIYINSASVVGRQVKLT
jgi:hypothetical protein